MDDQSSGILVGKPVQRVEDLRLLRGKGQFVDDLHVAQMLHAAFLRSSVGHGRIRSIDVSHARKLEGVHAAYTADEIAAASNGAVPTIGVRLAPWPEVEPFAQPVIAQFKVRHVGEILAMVVADSPAIAEDALELIVVDIEPLPAVIEASDSVTNRQLLFDEAGRNTAITYAATKGDAPSAPPPYTRRERLKIQRHAAVCLETRGIIAHWDDVAQRLRVLGVAKVPFALRTLLARHMRLTEDSIDMIEADIGGGFGVRGTYHPEDFLVPHAARALSRPVKWIEDRRENLLSANHSREAEIEIELDCDRDGTILSLRGNALTDAGAYVRSATPGAPRNLAQFLSGPYRIPHIHVLSSIVLTNKTPIGTYRGPGRFEADFFRERLFDLVAGDLGIDRVEFRRRNLPTESEMPYPIATISKPERSEKLDSGNYGLTLDRCLREIDWHEKTALQGRLVDGRYHGLGIGCFIEGGAAGPRENARIAVDREGQVSLFVGSTNVGQGLETVCLQIAADALDMPMDRIRLFHGSTTYLKEGFGSYHSRSVVMGGSAILKAADRLKIELQRIAGLRLNCAADQVTIGRNLVASHQGRSLALTEIASDPIEAHGTFENNIHTYAYGAAAAHVAVDVRTGHVQVLEFVAVEDVGRAINPLTTEGQIVGAVVQGLGGSLLEHLVYDADGQLLTGTLADYLLPLASDFPNIKAIVLSNSPAPNNPLGAKGAGEGGIVPVGGVIANAVANALGKCGEHLRQLPVSPTRIWQLCQEHAL